MMKNTGLLLFTLLLLSNIGFAQQIDPAPKATVDQIKGAFRDVPDLQKAFIDASPKARKDGIPVGKLGADGGDKAMILKLAQEIGDSLHGKFDSFLIAHKDKLIFESYYSRGRINLPHPQASATKAHTGLALGRAIQLGYLTMDDLHKPLISFLKELDPTKFVVGAEKITLHKALTMRSGIRLSKEQRETFKKNPDLVKGQKEVQAWLTHSEPITSATQTFQYSGDPVLIMQVIDAVVPGSAKDFIKTELLDKMGITNYIWPTAFNGLPHAGSRARLTSRDMIKIGTLARNNGKWNGKQLIPEAYINKAISRILYTGDEEIHYGGKDVSKQGYGYYWWSANLKHGDKSYFAVSAQGGYGQFIVLIEELDLMVVFTGHDNDTNYLQIIAERILPAFDLNSSSAMSSN
ncbi:serine hydrolase domain-containing protein [Flavivirga eckloniae]|nr:serine hydrolase [Flavivirga eckloniae]